MAAQELKAAVQRLMAAIRQPNVEVVVQRRDIEVLLAVKATPPPLPTLDPRQQ